MTLAEQLHRNESTGGYDLDDHKHIVPMAVLGLGALSIEKAAQQEETQTLVAQDFVLAPDSDN